jgi:hypothetical protein
MNGANPVASAGTVPQALSKTAAQPDTAGKIYNNDEPSPLDPPSGDDRKKMIATILAEESSPQGRSGVANVIRNRAVDGSYGGDTPSAVVQSPNQFEPWNTPEGRAKMAAALQNPGQVAQADAAIQGAYGEGGKAPEDPTEGKTMFYAPGAQAALGRSALSWAQGEGQKLGSSLFYDDNSGTPQNAQPAQGQLPAGPQVAQADPQAAQRQQLQAWAQRAAMSQNPSIRQMAIQTLEQLNKPRDHFTDKKDEEGNWYQVNDLTGQKTIIKAAEKDPGSVQEYEYYKKNLGPGEQPMPYQTWSVQKARAGATNVTTTVGGENKGMEEAQKLDAEAVGRGQNEKLPALEDADHNFQIMQDAIERNGGKLPTGGILGKLGLDARRTAGYIRENWGIDLGDDPTTAVSLETFNKGGIKASGDMAKAIGGNRVLKVEFDMAQKANPGLETTDGGNKYLLDLNRSTIAIQKDHLQVQEDYWRTHNHSLDGFQKSWNEEVKANPRPLSNFSVAPPINNGDGSQFVKLPSTGQGGYTWYRKGQDGLSPITDQKVTSRLEESAQPLKATPAAPVEKVFNNKTYIKQDGNWFEKPAGGTQ